MATDFTYVKKLTENMTDALTDYAELLGREDRTKEAKYGFVPGLGLETEPQELKQKIEEFKQGIFQVMFTGVFSGGKSTLINALLKKNLLGVAITPETAAITKIIFGASEEAVTVYYKEETEKHPAAEKMSVNEFFHKFRLESEKDDKFIDVNHAEITQKESLFENMVQLVDSPGLNHSGVDDEKSESFLKNADAVVFLINATQALNAREKDYINAKFANRQLKNVFFVITRYDSVNEKEVEKFQENTLSVLYNVFVDKDGNFDEELYKERVFYTNAYGSLCARTGEPYVIKVGMQKLEVKIDDRETGVPEFENSLNDFLLSSDRDKAAFEAYRAKMAAMYLHATEKIDEVLDIYKRDLDGLEAEQKEVEKAIKEFKNIMEDIKTACSNASKEIVVEAIRAYDEFANDVDVSWDEYFKDRKIDDFGWGAMTKIIGEKGKDKVLRTLGKVFKNMKVNDPEYELAKDEKFKNLIAPVTKAITGFIDYKSETLRNNIGGAATLSFGKLEKILRQYDEKISELGVNLDLSSIYRQIAQNAGIDTSKITGDFSYGKLLLALLYHDYDGATTIILDSSRSWMDVIKDTIVNCIVEAIIASIVMALTGTYLIYIIARVAYGLFKMNKGFGNIAGKIIEGAKAETVNNIKESRLNYQISIENNIGGVITEANSKASKGLLDALQEKENTLNTIIANCSNKSFDLENEKDRFEHIKKAMVDIINKISKDLDGKAFSSKDIVDLAIK